MAHIQLLLITFMIRHSKMFQAAKAGTYTLMCVLYPGEVSQTLMCCWIAVLFTTLVATTEDKQKWAYARQNSVQASYKLKPINQDTWKYVHLHNPQFKVPNNANWPRKSGHLDKQDT